MRMNQKKVYRCRVDSLLIVKSVILGKNLVTKIAELVFRTFTVGGCQNLASTSGGTQLSLNRPPQFLCEGFPINECKP